MSSFIDNRNNLVVIYFLPRKYTAGSIKAILDTPLLTDDGLLTDESSKITEEIGKLIYKYNE